jgi:Methylamine utilisation protein MauE
MDPVIDAALRTGLSVLFLAAAVHKLRDLGRFRATLAEYRLLSPRLVAPGAIALVVTEFALAVALVAPCVRTAGSVAAAVLLSIYGGAMAVNLARGRRHIDCGCAGPAARRPISALLVARNAVLAAAALGGLVPLSTRPLSWVDGVTVLGATGTLAALYSAFDRLLMLAPARAMLRGGT